MKWTLREFSCKTVLAHTVQHYLYPPKLNAWWCWLRFLAMWSVVWFSKCAYKLIWGSWLIMSPRNKSKRWLAVCGRIKQSSVTRIWTSMWIPNTNQAPVELLLDDQIIKTHCTNYNMERQISSARTNSHKNMCDSKTSSAIYCTLLHWKWPQTSNTEKVALNTFLSLSTLLDPETVKSVLL